MSDEENEEEGRGFTVVDKRASADSEPEQPPAAALPQADFQGLCLSLATSALYHLGVAGDPETGEPAAQKNLPAAQQTIDILAMLREKTSGNLDDEESRLLDAVLYDLRMRFVEAGKADAG